MTENNNNKNIWLAVALSIITSVTSLGTAFISKEDPNSNKIIKVSKNLDDIKEELNKLEIINKELHRLILTNESKSNRKIKKLKKEIDVLKLKK
jgi:cupin superfamily acireductone dioxygenase involved in methionine salvage